VLIAVKMLPKDDPFSAAVMLGWIPSKIRRMQMDRIAFEAELREQGYGEVVDRRMEANALNPEHAHEFDARLLVLEGAMTIASEGKERTYRAGDTFSMSVGCRHAEQCGPEGVRYLAGRRNPKA
jgi:quercetin dioxygenase-like cupin family protein